MNLKINDKETFIRDFLKPITQFSETAVFNNKNGEMQCIVSSVDNSTILYTRHLTGVTDDEDITINVPSVDKLVNSLKLIEGNEINLIINTNNLQYKSNLFKFKYHLYEDGILSIPKLNIDKINAFKYDVEFEISAELINQIVKSSTVAGDANKVYFYSKDQNIYAELTDRTIDNSDMFSFCLIEGHTGNEITTPIPLMLDAIRSFSTLRQPATVCINNEYGIAKFDINVGSTRLQYIVTSVIS